MSFHQLLFPFVFLPLSLLLFGVLPGRAKKYSLLLCSLVFIAWGNPGDLVLLLGSALFNYVSASELSMLRKRGANRRAHTVLLTSVAANLLFLGFFKYFNFIVDNINALLHVSLGHNPMAAPIGISFFTFSALSFLFDVNRGVGTVPNNPVDFILYITFFPKLTSGPILQYSAWETQISSLTLQREKLEGGARLFVMGLAKKLLLANTLALPFQAISALSADALTALSAWIGALTYAFMLYFDFSGYSDMASGVSLMFGIVTPKNFKYPYRAVSVTDFWRRWHVSLGAWFRDYVYIPLGGSREGNVITLRNTMVVWLLTGIWHGANWTFLVWGLLHGVMIVIEKFVLKKPLSKLPNALRAVLTFLCVVIGWVFFFSPSLSSAVQFLKAMCFLKPVADGTAFYYLRGSWLLLLVAGFGATPLLHRVGVALRKRRVRWYFPALAITFCLLLALCIAAMVSDTYSSFLYAQF